MHNPLFRLPRNVFTNYLSVFVGFLVNFLLTPFLISNLGEVAFGLWILVNSLRQYFQLLEFGTNPAIIKLVSEYGAKDEKKKINEIASSSLFMFILFGLFAIIISIVLSYYSADYIKIPASYHQTARSLILITGGNVLFFMVKRGLNAILTGFHRFDIKNLISVSGELFQASLTVVLLFKGFGLTSLALLMVCANCLEIIALLYILIRQYDLQFGFSFISQKRIKKIFHFSIFTFINDLSSRIAWNLDVLVIGYFLPVSSVTAYTIGVRLARVVEKLLNPLIHIFFPIASTWGAQDQNKQLQLLMLEGTKISLLFSLPLGTLIFFTGKSLINLWVGPEYLSGFPVLEIFLIIFIVSNMESTASQIQLGMGRLHFNTIVSSCSALMNLMLSITLIHYYGIVGVALGTVIPNSIANIIFSIPYTCYILRLPIKKLIVYSFLPAFVPLLVPSIVLFMVGDYVKAKAFPESFRVIGVSILFLSFYITTYVLFFSSSEERAKVKKMLCSGLIKK